MSSKKSAKKNATGVKATRVRKTANAATLYRIRTPEERTEVEWLVKDGTYRSVAHYEEIMTRQMAAEN